MHWNCTFLFHLPNACLITLAIRIICDWLRNHVDENRKCNKRCEEDTLYKIGQLIQTSCQILQKQRERSQNKSEWQKRSTLINILFRKGFLLVLQVVHITENGRKFLLWSGSVGTWIRLFEFGRDLGRKLCPNESSGNDTLS